MENTERAESMTIQEQIKFQELLEKKQIFIQKAIEEINNNRGGKNTKNGKKSRSGKANAIRYINIDSGFNTELVKILETG